MIWLKRSAAVLFALGMFLSLGCESPEKAGATAALPDYDRPVVGKALELVTDPAQFPNFREMFADKDATTRAIDASLAWFAKPSSERRYPYHDYPEITHARAVRSLKAIKEVLRSSNTPEDLQGGMVSNFDVYRSVGWDSKSGIVLFTGYYTPIFDGSREKTRDFSYPLYKLPADLVKDPDGTPRGRRTANGETVAYYTRSEIDGQEILKGHEIVWLRSRLDAYIIHVQGSAEINLTGGGKLYLGYAGKTDRPYHGLGETLVSEGRIRKNEISLSKIREYFSAHPEEADRFMNMNESYVFFRESDPGGPYGSIGAPVTAYRTLATDKDLFPWGAPCGVVTELPDGATFQRKAYTSFACDQDRGGAIKSAGRCDVYVGVGPNAEKVAGHTYCEGRLFYFFVKDGSTLARN